MKKVTRLLKNIYGDTLHSIIYDLESQIKNLQLHVEIEENGVPDKEDLEKLEILITLIKEPIRVYNKYYHGKIEIPKLKW